MRVVSFPEPMALFYVVGESEGTKAVGPLMLQAVEHTEMEIGELEVVTFGDQSVLACPVRFDEKDIAPMEGGHYIFVWEIDERIKALHDLWSDARKRGDAQEAQALFDGIASAVRQKSRTMLRLVR